MKHFYLFFTIILLATIRLMSSCQDDMETFDTKVYIKSDSKVGTLLLKNRHKAQRKAKFYINKCRSASCMQSGWKRTPA